MTKKQEIIFLILILGLAAFFRFYQLNNIPPGLYPDVAINGNDALQALNTGDFKVFYPENNGREGLFINLIALSFLIFGPSIWAIKIVPAIIGILTVPGLYLLTKELFKMVNSQWSKVNSQFVALLSSFFLAISFWHINFSRIGFRAIMTPFFLVWSFYFLFRGLKATPIHELHANDTNKKFLLTIGYWLISGLLFGLGFHTYIAFRVAPLILGVIFLIEAIKYWPILKNKFQVSSFKFQVFKEVYIKDGWFKWDIFFIGIIIAVLPLALYFYQHPQDFLGRSSQISIFASQNPLKELGLSAVKTLGQFNFFGDCNWRHNFACKPQFSIPIGILFLIGFFYPILQILLNRHPEWSEGSRGIAFLLRDSSGSALRMTTMTSLQRSLFNSPYPFLYAWFFVMLLPSILSNEGLPHALRSIGAIPVAMIFAGIGAAWIMEKILQFILKFKDDWRFPRLRKELTALLFVFLIGLSLSAYKKYFILWPGNINVKNAFSANLTAIGNYLNSLPPQTQKYVIVNLSGVPVPYPDGVPMPAQTVMFIESANPLWKSDFHSAQYLLPEQISQIENKAETVIIPLHYDQELVKKLKEKFPQSQIKNYADFSVIKIKK